MRKFCLILLAIGMIVAFTMPVSAADVKFSGSYVAQGYYENNRKLSDPEDGDFHNVWQRLRIGTVFQIADGLKLTTRFDAMEKIWGAAAQPSASSHDTGIPSAENDNIKFDNVFVDFVIPIGTIQAGYMNKGAWGTVFGNTSENNNGPRVRYIFVGGPVTLRAVWDKVEGKKGYNSAGPAGQPIDHDSEQYSLEGWYTWKAGEAGLQLQYIRDTSTADTVASYTANNGYKRKYFQINPYAKAKFGPVYVEAELGFAFGKYKEYIDENTGRDDVDMKAWRGYLMANVDLAPAYVGAVAFYASGDDPGSKDEMEGGLNVGVDFNPCLIMMNYDLSRWNGALGGANGVSVGSGIDNVQGYQLFVGVKPIPKLDVKASVTYAKLNENPTTTPLVSKKLGYEADITATYKIYDNLSYMIGFGYLWSGDAFKGTSDENKVENDYLLTHKLTLTF
ncbi:MAG: hypothetical protein ABFD82_18895 [Syntrophaceae bacterium]